MPYYVLDCARNKTHDSWETTSYLGHLWYVCAPSLACMTVPNKIRNQLWCFKCLMWHHTCKLVTNSVLAIQLLLLQHSQLHEYMFRSILDSGSWHLESTSLCISQSSPQHSWQEQLEWERVWCLSGFMWIVVQTCNWEVWMASLQYGAGEQMNLWMGQMLRESLPLHWIDGRTDWKIFSKANPMICWMLHWLTQLPNILWTSR